MKLLLAQQHEERKTTATPASCAESYHCDNRDDDDAGSIFTVRADVLQPPANEPSASEAVNVVHSNPSSPLAVNDLETIIEHITNVHLSQTPLTPDVIAALPEREKRYLVSLSIRYKQEITLMAILDTKDRISSAL